MAHQVEDAVVSRQDSTVVSVGCLSRTPYTGNYILAEQVEVESCSWWAQHPNIRCVIQCTDRRHKVCYPRDAAAKSQHFYVDPREADTREDELNEAMPTVIKTLREGGDVLHHCRQSVHRAPVVCAAVHKRLTGVEPAVSTPA